MFSKVLSIFHGSLNFEFALFCSKDMSTGGDCVHQHFIEQCDSMLLLGGAGVVLNMAGVVGVKVRTRQNHDKHGLAEEKDNLSLSGYSKSAMSTIHGKEPFNAGNGLDPLLQII